MARGLYIATRSPEGADLLHGGLHTTAGSEQSKATVDRQRVRQGKRDSDTAPTWHSAPGVP